MNQHESVEFPEYASKYYSNALESREQTPPEVKLAIAYVEQALAEDPDAFPDRVIPASLDGTTCVYRHLDPEFEITFQVDREKKIIYFFHYSAPSFRVKKTVFISYSREDKEWLPQIKKFLTVLDQYGVIEYRDDTQLKAGELWESKIRQAIDSANAAILLVSQNFLTSQFIREVELPRILEQADRQGKKVFWLPLSHCTVKEHPEITRFHSLLGDPDTPLEALDENRRKKALVEMNEELRRAVGI